VRKPIPVEISSRAMVRIEGAWYSVPSRWARLNATAYLGVDDVRITCMGESVTHPRGRDLELARFAIGIICPSFRASLTPCARSRRS
jgi:hypothetical protein